MTARINPKFQFMRNSITQKSRNDDDSWTKVKQKKNKSFDRWRWICMPTLLCNDCPFEAERMLSYLRRSLSPLMAASYASVAISSPSWFFFLKSKMIRSNSRKKSTMIKKFGIWGKTETLGFKSRQDYDFIKMLMEECDIT